MGPARIFTVGSAFSQKSPTYQKKNFKHLSPFCHCIISWHFSCLNEHLSATALALIKITVDWRRALHQTREEGFVGIQNFRQNVTILLQCRISFTVLLSTLKNTLDDFRWTFEQWVEKRKLPRNTYNTTMFWTNTFKEKLAKIYLPSWPLEKKIKSQVSRIRKRRFVSVQNKVAPV